MTTPPPVTSLSPHDAWFEAFGRAWLGDDAKAPRFEGQCTACGADRADLLKKGRMICVRCAPMSAKKAKRAGGKAGPSPNQSALISDVAAVYAGPLVAPTGLPACSRMDERHGEAFVLATLYEPPQPPFYLMHMAMNSDPVLGNTRLTRNLRRFHIGSLVPVTLDQPLLRESIDLVMQHPEPRKALRVLEEIQRPLSRGPGADQDAWEKAMDRWDELTDQCQALTRRFGDDGRWPVRPADSHWDWLKKLVAAKERGDL